MLEHPSNRIYWVSYGKYFDESEERESLRLLAPLEFDLRLGENGIRFKVRARRPIGSRNDCFAEL